MYSYVTGMTDDDNIFFCPRCGEEIRRYNGDGTAVCSSCRLRFGVGSLKKPQRNRAESQEIWWIGGNIRSQ